MKNVMFLAVIISLVMCSVASAEILNVDLRATAVSGGLTLIDAHNVRVNSNAAIGDKITLQVWAKVNCPDGTDDLLQIQTVNGKIQETSVGSPVNAKGDISWGTKKTGTASTGYAYTTPFNQGSLPTASTNAWGDKELGNAIAEFNARAGAMQDETSGTYIQMGLLTYTLNTVGPTVGTTTVLNWVPDTTNTGYLFQISTNQDTWQQYGGGSTGILASCASNAPINVYCIPEPATLVLLGLSCLALLVFRRRK